MLFVFDLVLEVAGLCVGHCYGKCLVSRALNAGVGRVVDEFIWPTGWTTDPATYAERINRDKPPCPPTC